MANTIPSSPPPRAASLRIGVTPKGYTDPEGTLRHLGCAFKQITCEELASPAALAGFDALLLASSIMCAEEELVARVAPALRDWVEQGGVLWACDWSLLFLVKAFPEAVTLLEERADAQTVRATVLDDQLLAALAEREIILDLRLDNWRLLWATPRVPRASLAGDVTGESGRLPNQPLMIAFSAGKGDVLASSMGFESFPEKHWDQMLYYALNRGPLQNSPALPTPPARAPAASHPSFVLRIKTGSQEQERAMGDQPLKVGRGEKNDVDIHDTTVSKKHCVFEVKKGLLYVQPLEPLNDLLVDDKPVKDSTELKPGSVVTLGDSTKVTVEQR